MRVEFTSKTSKDWAVEGKYLFREDVPIHIKYIENIKVTNVPVNKYQEGEITVDFLSGNQSILKFSYEDNKLASAVVKYVVQNKVAIKNNNTALECTLESCLEQFGISANDIIVRKKQVSVEAEKNAFLEKLEREVQEEVEKKMKKVNRTVKFQLILIGIAGLIWLMILFSGGSSSSEWDKLSDEEKEWYEDNYGDGKMEDINEAIEDYKNNN